ncbi:lipase family protein [Melioribacter sp. OK-6-Me]|uniref:lipase family protein n=1 Tax=unclassified Melioribacter TaxID=2627329 RepID=UPI003ED9C09A
MKKNIKYFLLIILLLGCERGSDLIGPLESERGKIIDYEKIATYNSDLLLTLASEYDDDNISNITSNKSIHDVEVYKIIYNTVGYDNKIEMASGIVFIPVGTNNLSMISIQHGTQTNRKRVGSVNPLFALEGLIAAALGYYACEPDYLGLGISEIVHPYHHYQTSANSVIDFLRAAREFAYIQNLTLNGKLFLAGYSEGGYVTMAVQREIELNHRNEFNITASAPMAGAYDLELTATKILENDYYPQPAFLAYLIYAYSKIYKWNDLNYFFNEPYASAMHELFDGSKNIEMINESLPKELKQLLAPEFLSSIQNKTEKRLLPKLKENSLINWSPSTPMRLYHGDKDDFVPVENSYLAYDYFSAHGANVDLIIIHNGTHYTSAVPALIDLILWFDSFNQSHFYVQN